MHTELIDYIESLRLCQGRKAGQPFILERWEKRFLRGAFGQPGDAGLSLGRGNGKTTFSAAIMAATLDGPLAQPMAESVLVASSFDQGQIAFRHLIAFLQPAIQARPQDWRIQDSANRSSITYLPVGASARVIGSDPQRMMGLAPSLVLADEIASWPPTKIDAALSALSTSMGKIQNSKMLWIGTRAAGVGHPFEKALYGGLPYAQVHAARESDSPYRKTTWVRANPGLNGLPDLEQTIRREAGKARIDPVALASFEALRLNRGVPATLEDILIPASVWESCESAEPDKAGPYVLGIDLSQNAAISACSGYWPETGALEAIGALPEEPPLLERGQRLGVGDRLLRMAQEGDLFTLGEMVVDVGLLLERALGRWGVPRVIVSDYWRLSVLKQELGAVGFPTESSLVGRRNGPYDGGEDCFLFRNAVLDGKVTPKRSLLLRSCMAAARVTSDSGGNVYLTKKGRMHNDAAASSIIAVAEGIRRTAGDDSEREIEAVVV